MSRGILGLLLCVQLLTVSGQVHADIFEAMDDPEWQFTPLAERMKKRRNKDYKTPDITFTSFFSTLFSGVAFPFKFIGYSIGAPAYDFFTLPTDSNIYQEKNKDEWLKPQIEKSIKDQHQVVMALREYAKWQAYTKELRQTRHGKIIGPTEYYDESKENQYVKQIQNHYTHYALRIYFALMNLNEKLKEENKIPITRQRIIETIHLLSTFERVISKEERGNIGKRLKEILGHKIGQVDIQYLLDIFDNKKTGTTKKHFHQISEKYESLFLSLPQEIQEAIAINHAKARDWFFRISIEKTNKLKDLHIEKLIQKTTDQIWKETQKRFGGVAIQFINLNRLGYESVITDLTRKNILARLPFEIKLKNMDQINIHVESILGGFRACLNEIDNFLDSTDDVEECQKIFMEEAHMRVGRVLYELMFEHIVTDSSKGDPFFESNKDPDFLKAKKNYGLLEYDKCIEKNYFQNLDKSIATLGEDKPHKFDPVMETTKCAYAALASSTIFTLSSVLRRFYEDANGSDKNYDKDVTHHVGNFIKCLAQPPPFVKYKKSLNVDKIPYFYINYDALEVDLGYRKEAISQEFFQEKLLSCADKVKVAAGRALIKGIVFKERLLNEALQDPTKVLKIAADVRKAAFDPCLLKLKKLWGQTGATTDWPVGFDPLMCKPVVITYATGRVVEFKLEEVFTNTIKDNPKKVLELFGPIRKDFKQCYQKVVQSQIADLSWGKAPWTESYDGKRATKRKNTAIEKQKSKAHDQAIANCAILAARKSINQLLSFKLKDSPLDEKGANYVRVSFLEDFDRATRKVENVDGFQKVMTEFAAHLFPKAFVKSGKFMLASLLYEKVPSELSIPENKAVSALLEDAKTEEYDQKLKQIDLALGKLLNNYEKAAQEYYLAVEGKKDKSLIAAWKKEKNQLWIKLKEAEKAFALEEEEEIVGFATNRLMLMIASKLLHKKLPKLMSENSTQDIAQVVFPLIESLKECLGVNSTGQWVEGAKRNGSDLCLSKLVKESAHSILDNVVQFDLGPLFSPKAEHTADHCPSTQENLKDYKEEFTGIKQDIKSKLENCLASIAPASGKERTLDNVLNEVESCGNKVKSSAFSEVPLKLLALKMKDNFPGPVKDLTRLPGESADSYAIRVKSNRRKRVNTHVRNLIESSAKGAFYHGIAEQAEKLKQPYTRMNLDMSPPGQRFDWRSQNQRTIQKFEKKDFNPAIINMQAMGALQGAAMKYFQMMDELQLGDRANREKDPQTPFVGFSICLSSLSIARPGSDEKARARTKRSNAQILLKCLLDQKVTPDLPQHQVIVRHVAQLADCLGNIKSADPDVYAQKLDHCVMAGTLSFGEDLAGTALVGTGLFIGDSNQNFTRNKIYNCMDKKLRRPLFSDVGMDASFQRKNLSDKADEIERKRLADYQTLLTKLPKIEEERKKRNLKKLCLEDQLNILKACIKPREKMAITFARDAVIYAGGKIYKSKKDAQNIREWFANKKEGKKEKPPTPVKVVEFDQFATRAFSTLLLLKETSLLPPDNPDKIQAKKTLSEAEKSPYPILDQLGEAIGVLYEYYGKEKSEKALNSFETDIKQLLGRNPPLSQKEVFKLLQGQPLLGMIIKSMMAHKVGTLLKEKLRANLTEDGGTYPAELDSYIDAYMEPHDPKKGKINEVPNFDFYFKDVSARLAYKNLEHEKKALRLRLTGLIDHLEILNGTKDTHFQPALKVGEDGKNHLDLATPGKCWTPEGPYDFLVGWYDIKMARSSIRREIMDDRTTYINIAVTQAISGLINGDEKALDNVTDEIAPLIVKNLADNRKVGSFIEGLFARIVKHKFKSSWLGRNLTAGWSESKRHKPSARKALDIFVDEILIPEASGKGSTAEAKKRMESEVFWTWN